MKSRHRSLCVAILCVASGTALSQFAWSDSNRDHKAYLVAYDIGDLPVWRICDNGEREFDPSILIAQIKNSISPDCPEGTFHPFPDHASIVIAATRSDHEEVTKLLESFRLTTGDKRTAKPCTGHRRAIAMVELKEGGLLPVDKEGNLLPVEIGAQEAQDYPRIDGINSRPAGPPGTSWGDSRVVAAVQIVCMLDTVWDRLHLHRVEVASRDSFADDLPSQGFILVTDKQRHFLWGSAPGEERCGEKSAEHKVKQLKKYLDDHNNVDNIFE